MPTPAFCAAERQHRDVDAKQTGTRGVPKKRNHSSPTHQTLAQWGTHDQATTCTIQWHRGSSLPAHKHRGPAVCDGTQTQPTACHAPRAALAAAGARAAAAVLWVARWLSGGQSGACVLCVVTTRCGPPSRQVSVHLSVVGVALQELTLNEVLYALLDVCGGVSGGGGRGGRRTDRCTAGRG